MAEMSSSQDKAAAVKQPREWISRGRQRGDHSWRRWTRQNVQGHVPDVGWQNFGNSFHGREALPQPGNSLAQAVSVLPLHNSLVTQYRVHSHGGLSQISPAAKPALSTGSAHSSASRKGDSKLCFSPAQVTPLPATIGQQSLAFQQQLSSNKLGLASWDCTFQHPEEDTDFILMCLSLQGLPFPGTPHPLQWLICAMGTGISAKVVWRYRVPPSAGGLVSGVLLDF